jgi:hypothetical protein
MKATQGSVAKSVVTHDWYKQTIATTKMGKP